MTAITDHEEAHAPSITGGSAMLLGSRVIANLAAFAAVVAVAHALGPSGRGTVAFVATASMLAASLSHLGTDEAVIVFAARSPSRRPVLLANLMLFTALASLAVACAVVAVLMGAGLRPAGAGTFEELTIPVGAVGNAVCGAAVAYLLGCRRHLAQAACTAVPSLMFCGLVGITWAMVGLDVRRAIVCWAGAQVVSGLVGLCLCVWVAGIGRPDLRLFSESSGFAARAWLTTLAWYVNARADQFIMGFISTDATLGIYVVAVNASETVLQVPSVVSRVLLPAVAARSPEERKATTLNVLRLLQVISVGLLAIGYACAPLIPLLFGAAFRPSILPYAILLPGLIPFTMMVVFSSALMASSFPGRASLVLFAALAAGIVLDLALIPPLGEVGAAIAATAGFLAGGVAGALIYRATAGLTMSEMWPRASDVGQLRSLALRMRDAGLRRIRT
jgi:O-antigen/teichoic acid export membrane protein